MIINFDNSDAFTAYDADLCIVGSGAAALAIVSALNDTRLNILILEAGGENITAENQQVYDVTTPFHPFQGARDGRFRVFGGSTTKWGGQALPYDANDFVQRDWVPFSGWPIAYQDVEKYYNKVDKFLHIDPLSYETDIYKLIKKSPLDIDADLLVKFSKWSPKPNLREEQRQQIKRSEKILLLQNASLTSIHLTDNGHSTEGLHFKNQEGKTGNIRAKSYVLACGGIENARLLLASNKQATNGIGNDHDVVGRFLQDHPNAPIGKLTSDYKDIQAYYNYFYVNKTRILPRFMISEAFQQKHRILNSSAYLKFISNEDDPFSIAKELYRKKIRHELTTKELKASVSLFKHLPQMLQIGKRYFVNKQVYTPKPQIRLDLMMETPPARENRITLGAEKDALGMPRAVVSWKLNSQVYHTLETCAALFQKHFSENGLGKLHLEDWITNKNYGHNLIDAKHHIGTTRMSSTLRDGVVDVNSRVHNISNLYIAGSSVFPTSGHSNPTSTLLALSFRLADHLKTVLV